MTPGISQNRDSVSRPINQKKALLNAIIMSWGRFRMVVHQNVASGPKAMSRTPINNSHPIAKVEASGAELQFRIVSVSRFSVSRIFAARQRNLLPRQSPYRAHMLPFSRIPLLLALAVLHADK